MESLVADFVQFPGVQFLFLEQKMDTMLCLRLILKFSLNFLFHLNFPKIYILSQSTNRDATCTFNF